MQEREDFLKWIHEAAEAEEKAELREKIQQLELENESLQGSPEEPNVDPLNDSRDEFERDLLLMEQAEVLADMLAEEGIDRKPVVTERTDNAEVQLEAADAPENVDEVEDEEAESEVE